MDMVFTGVVRFLNRRTAVVGMIPMAMVNTAVTPCVVTAWMPR